MVTFAKVGQYLSRTRYNNPTKQYVRDVFRRLRKGELYIPGRSTEAIENLFRTQECRLWMAFIVTLKIDKESVFATHFTDFSGDGLELGPLYVLLKEFLTYEQQVMPDEVSIELPAEPGAVVTAAFLVCNDHEGIMPMAIMTTNVTPEAGLYILHMALLQRIVGLPKK